jgi:hypothetical protein
MLNLFYLLTFVRVHPADLLRRGGGAGGIPMREPPKRTPPPHTLIINGKDFRQWDLEEDAPPRT